MKDVTRELRSVIVNPLWDTVHDRLFAQIREQVQDRVGYLGVRIENRLWYQIRSSKVPSHILMSTLKVLNGL